MKVSLSATRLFPFPSRPLALITVALTVGSRRYFFAAEGATTFLNSYLKQNPITKEWLQKNAGRWIGEAEVEMIADRNTL